MNFVTILKNKKIKYADEFKEPFLENEEEIKKKDVITQIMFL